VLLPLRPTAWQREQLVVSNPSPRLSSARLSCGCGNAAPADSKVRAKDKADRLIIGHIGSICTSGIAVGK
jgi:hypothetical protein